MPKHSGNHRLRFAIVVAVLLAGPSCKRAAEGEDRSTTGDPAKQPYQSGSMANHTPQVPKTLPPPTERQLRGLEEALAAVENTDADMRCVAALTGLMIASSGRIPPQLASDILAFNNAPTRQRSATFRAVFDNSAWVFDEVCGQQFESAFAEGQATGDRGETARHVWRECRLARYSLLGGEAEFVESSSRTGPEPILAYFVYAYLEAHGGAHPSEAKLLREVALGSPTESQRPDTVEDWLSAH